MLEIEVLHDADEELFSVPTEMAADFYCCCTTCCTACCSSCV